MLIHHASEQKGAVPRSGIADALNQISAPQLRAWVEAISMPRHYVAQRENNEWICRWLMEKLQSFGYDAVLQGQFNNVLALPKATGQPLTLIGAHYDSVPQTDGADDNGSAVAALLGCAQAVALTAARERTGFVLFNREEDGLQGSLDFVEDHVRARKLQVSGAHILEMVGYASKEPGSQKVPAGLPISIPETGNFLGLLANQSSAGIQAQILRAAKTYLPDFPVIGLHVALGLEKFFPVLHRSDHAPFWEQGIPAVMWTDTSEFRNPNYHTFDDTPDSLNYEFLQTVTQLLTACVLHGENSP